jgi:hypothetical protein
VFQISAIKSEIKNLQIKLDVASNSERPILMEKIAAYNDKIAQIKMNPHLAGISSDLMNLLVRCNISLFFIWSKETKEIE